MLAHGNRQFNTPQLIPAALHECGYHKCNARALKIVKALLRLELALKLWRTNVHKTYAHVHGPEMTILYCESAVIRKLE